MSARGKVFMSGRSQAVRLPKEFRLACKEVRITRTKEGLLLQPVRSPQEVLDEIDRISDRSGPFELERNQPATPIEDLFD